MRGTAKTTQAAAPPVQTPTRPRISSPAGGPTKGALSAPTGGAGAASAANAVHIVFGAGGHIVVDDQLDVLDICTAQRTAQREEGGRRRGRGGRVWRRGAGESAGGLETLACRAGLKGPLKAARVKAGVEGLAAGAAASCLPHVLAGRARISWRHTPMRCHPLAHRALAAGCGDGNGAELGVENRMLEHSDSASALCTGVGGWHGGGGPAAGGGRGRGWDGACRGHRGTAGASSLAAPSTQASRQGVGPVRSDDGEAVRCGELAWPPTLTLCKHGVTADSAQAARRGHAGLG